MSFQGDLDAFALKLNGRQREVFVGCVTAVRDSIVLGSPTTGAPGQPVDTGNLVSSWQQTFPKQWVGEVTTNVAYAPAIEDGVQQPYTSAHGKTVVPRPMQFKSAVGGPHSVALTRAGWERTVDAVVTEVVK